ncbi:TetR/AcrR family transcriptional regulator [Phenylobacterium sp. LjRoot219]|uniref:TetR/AcrR family transcriptional regulator n=1 Tax=Phenylobacterium sp. LjRoot219 TaxID=3342283 RepID=UPI003ECDA45E
MTDARVVRNRAGLRQALLDLLEGAPLEQVTVRDIAAKAGVGYTTYFRHYPNKDALLRDLAASEVARLSDLTTPVYDAVDSRAACRAIFAYVDQHRVTWSALLTGAAGFVRDEMLQRGRQDVATRANSWLPGDLGVVLGVTVIVELLTWWLRQETPPPIDFMADVLDRTGISPARPGIKDPA